MGLEIVFLRELLIANCTHELLIVVVGLQVSFKDVRIGETLPTNTLIWTCLCVDSSFVFVPGCVIREGVRAMTTRIGLLFRVDLAYVSIQGKFDRELLSTVFALEVTYFVVNDLDVGL